MSSRFITNRAVRPFVGIALCLTLLTRQPAMSIGLLMVVWCGLMLASEQLIKLRPFLWPIGVYRSPINRTTPSTEFS